MPAICVFDGITITMYTDDHPPPHFHARYSGQTVVIEIQTMNIMQGSLPHSQLRRILEWAQRHQTELMADWDLAQQGLPLYRIAP